MYDLLICCQSLFARILLITFHLCSSVILACSFLFFYFFVISLSDFGITVMMTSQKEFGILPSSAIFWKNLNRIGVSSSLKFWYISPVKLSGPGLLFIGRFFITVLIIMLVMGLLRFSISFWFSLGRFCFSKNLSIFQVVHLLSYSC